MTVITNAAAALTFVWVGLVVGISFLEAPLKFRAPGVTIPLGLGIGRLVFRVLNRVELVLAVLIAAGAAAAASARIQPLVWAIAALVVLLVQLVFVRPRLNRRSDAVLSGGASEKRSSTHLYYVALELVKLAVLIALGVALFA
ncbi:MAG: hypothetical protein FWD85_05440 [Microbacteriaceae bacterium]|nr:hypothetical protein [Microbacteriaceae bacterium]MCL2794732.1 hypothetical protein [Microbacteriaceae bacterium]